jgi:hypothetical protein
MKMMSLSTIGEAPGSVEGTRRTRTVRRCLRFSQIIGGWPELADRWGAGVLLER